MVTTNESLELAPEVARQIFRSSRIAVSEKSQLFADLVEMARASIRGDALFPDRQLNSDAHLPVLRVVNSKTTVGKMNLASTKTTNSPCAPNARLGPLRTC